jgi:hypothetical protein
VASACEVKNGRFDAPAPWNSLRSTSGFDYPQQSVCDRYRPAEHAPDVPQAMPEAVACRSRNRFVV